MFAKWWIFLQNLFFPSKEANLKLDFMGFFYCQGFMMELTAHQGRVGNVLQVGSQLLTIGKLSDDEENEIQEQMNLLNSRWESLRVASMEKQSK